MVGKASMGISVVGKASMGVSVVCEGSNWVSGSGNWGSMGVSGVCDSDGGSMSNSVLDSNWVRDGVGLLLDDWGLNDVLDLVDLVGLWDSDWGWDLNLVRLGNVPVDNDLPLNWGWHSNWNLNLVFVDLQLRHNLGGLWGDHSVGPGGSQNLLVGDGISWGWAQVDWCWWNSSVWCWDNWSSWDGQLLGDNLVGGWGVDMAVSSWLVDRLSSLDVLVSNLDSPGASLDSAVSNNTLLHVGLGDSWASVDPLMDLGGSGTVGHTVSWGVGSYQTVVGNWGTSDQTMVGNWETTSVSGGGAADSGEKGQNQKSSHDVSCYCYCSE